MKQITVLVDKSGSMNVLGKRAVCEDLLKDLYLFPKINSCEDTLSFIQQNWNGSEEELKSICKDVDSFIILTDGYACNDNCESTLLELSSDKTKHFSIVLVGADSYFRQLGINNKISVFNASDINDVAETFARS